MLNKHARVISSHNFSNYYCISYQVYMLLCDTKTRAGGFESSTTTLGW